MELLLKNDRKVEVGMTFRKLAELRDKNKAAYGEYNRVVMNGPKEIFDYIAVIYAGYCCNAGENRMGYKEFLEFLPTDINKIVEAFNSVVSAQKK